MPHGIFPADLASMYVAEAGKQWTPSNGTEGEIFQSSSCASCARDRVMNGSIKFEDCNPEVDTCQILNASYRGEAVEWQIGRDGQPLCTEFTPSDEPAQTRCLHTMELPL